MKRDWAISLGAGGVAQGMLPAKYAYDVTAAPSCTTDFVVFPVNASTGNTRAKVVGTFTNEPAAGNTAAITITPSGGTAVTLTLTSSAASNTGLNFQVSTTVATNAANLAAAINRPEMRLPYMRLHQEPASR
jgi:outer membrane scaffolding protein for murein synthesis (MipA/OmpV family)